MQTSGAFRLVSIRLYLPQSVAVVVSPECHHGRRLGRAFRWNPNVPTHLCKGLQNLYSPVQIRVSPPSNCNGFRDFGTVFCLPENRFWCLFGAHCRKNAKTIGDSELKRATAIDAVVTLVFLTFQSGFSELMFFSLIKRTQ